MEENKKEDVIRLGDIFRVLWKNIILIAIITAAVFVCGIIYTYVIAKPQYRSSQSFIVAVRDTNTGEIVDGSTPSAFMINTVAGLVKQVDVLLPVAEEHDLSVGTLSGMVSVSYNTSSSSISGIITITVECGDSGLAQTLADEVFASLQNFLTSPSVGGSTSVQDVYGCAVIVTSPASAGTYVSPNKALYLVIFLIAGLVVGCIAVYIKEFCTNRFRNKEDVEFYLGERVIGYFVDDRTKAEKKLAKRSGGREIAEIIEPDMRNYEPYNKLLTNIKYSDVDNPYRVIMVTSSQERELKSSTLANFACCIAYNEHKVLLIDMDMRKPIQQKLFKVSKDKGIVEYVGGSCTKEEIIKHTKYGVDIITAGKRVINPVVIIESSSFKKLLSELSKEYDYILIDTPPMLACSDAATISKLCDGVVFNLAIKDVKKKKAAVAVRALRDVNARIIGINITKAPVNKRDEAYYYYNKYYMHSEPDEGHSGSEIK